MFKSSIGLGRQWPFSSPTSSFFTLPFFFFQSENHGDDDADVACDKANEGLVVDAEDNADTDEGETVGGFVFFGCLVPGGDAEGDYD